MADENISIEIKDNVAPTIDNKILKIAKSARDAHSAVENLRKSLDQIKGGTALSKLQVEANKLSSQVLKTAQAQEKLALASAKTSLAQQKLATETQKTQAAMAAVEVALNRAVIAEDKAAVSAAKLAAEQAKAQTAAQQLATAQQQTAAAAAKAQQAQTQATTAVTQGSTAQQALATATARTAQTQTQATTATARLATEQQRTAVQTANAAAASDRAALAALRLQQAQDRVTASSQRSTTGLMAWVRAGAAALGIALSAHAIIGMADAYTVLQNKLANVTTSQAQVAELTERLFDLANETRTPVQETATAFSRFDRALKILGKSQEDTLRLTETVNKALVVSGATAQESASALLQLSQAFNAGRLQGDEFRSVSENIPVVLDAVAKVLNKPIDQVKKLGSEGKITSEILFKAFKLIEGQIDETFKKTTPTISQALTVLNNSAIQAFGEFDKATGITRNLAGAIILLANNMDVLMVAATTVGSALLVYFGPVLLTAIRTATGAVVAFTAAIAANPIGLLLVAISAAVSAVIFFGDQITVTSNKAVTLKDVFLTAFNFIKKAAIGAAAAIVAVWNNFPGVLNGFFTDTVNFASIAISQILNLWQIGFRKIAEMAGSIAPELAANMTSVLDTLKIELPTMKVDESAKTAAAEIKKAFEKEFSGKSFMDTVSDEALSRRRAKGVRGGAASNLRGAGVSQISSGGDGKAEESRAKAMQKVNDELNNEIERLFMLKPLREAQAKFDDIELKLKQKKITLTAEEAKSIKERIALLQNANFVQAEFDRIYEESIEPARTHNAIMQATAKLLEQGAISQRKANDAVAASNETYQNAINPIRQYTKEIAEQMTLASLLPKEREIEQQMIQISNDLLGRKIVLTTEESTKLREQLTLLQQRNAINAQESAMFDQTVGKRQMYIDQLEAINNLLNTPSSGFTQGDAAASTVSLIQQMGLDPAGLQVAADASVGTLQVMYDQIEQMRAKDLISEQDAAGLKAQAWSAEMNNRIKVASTFFGSLEGLQKSNNKKMAAIGKAAAIANAIINTYTAATGAYAAMSAIPFVGPFLGAAAAGAAIVAGMANVAAIRQQNTGFMDGGFTGNIARNEVAGSVHGQEFVMDANTTARVGVSDLEALRSGAASIQRNGETAGRASPSVGIDPNMPRTGPAERTVTNNNTFVLPGITNAKEATESTAAISRGIISVTDSARRYR